MKKTTLALALAVPILAYPIASWVIGGEVDKLLTKQYAMLENNAVLQLVERKIQRGVFSSEEVVTFELKAEFMALLREQAEDEAPPAAPEPLRLLFRTHIKHGPVFGFSSMGLAKTRTELELNHPLIKQLYAGKSPLSVDSTVDFTGATHARARSPAAESLVDGRAIRWGEFVLELSSDRDMSKFSFQGGLPFVELRAEDESESLQVNNLAFKGQQARLFADNPYTYIGSASVSLQSLEARGMAEGMPPVRLNNLLATSNITEKNGFIDMLASYSMETLQVGEATYRGAHFDLALRHFEAKAWAELDQIAQNMGGAASEDEMSFAQFKPMLRPAKILLENSPEISIERMGVITPEGEIKASAALKLPNANVGNLAMAIENPLILMGLAAVIEANAQVSMPQTLLMASLSAEQTEMLLQLLQSGYVQNNNGQLSSAINYAQGKISINGQLIDPSSMMGAGH